MKYAIISDIHANLQALTAVLDKCKEEAIEKYICLGDIVGYNANPRECLEIVRSLDLVAVVKGNHDEYVSNNDEEMLGFNPHARAAVVWTKAQLNEEQRQWLANLPLKRTVHSSNITLVHATLDSPEAWGYIFDVYHAMDNFSYQFTQLCFCGHSHVPVAFCKKTLAMSTGSKIPVEEIDEWRGKKSDKQEEQMDDNLPCVIHLQTACKYLINIGSIGQPRNRDPRASFAIYDTEEKTVIRHRIEYDIASAQKSIREAKLPEKLALRLERGN